MILLSVVISYRLDGIAPYLSRTMMDILLESGYLRCLSTEWEWLLSPVESGLFFPKARAFLLPNEARGEED